jgi:predicted dehydrogenase
MSAGEVRVAVVGQGFMGRAHSFAWARTAQLAGTPLRPVLSVLVGRDKERLERNGRRWGFSQTSDDWRAAVQAPDVDLVDVCLPGAAHAEVSVAALQAGKHVLCEKPLANTVDQARRMADAAARAAEGGHFAMVGFNYRRVPALALARRLVLEEGRLGELRHLRARYLQDWLTDPEFPLSWRLVASEAGSGALGDLGAHFVDLVRYLTGSEVAEVAAFCETFVPERPLPAESEGLSAVRGTGRAAVSVDDAFVAVARLANGALATLEATRVAPGEKNGLKIELNGSLASVGFDLERLNELRWYEAGVQPEGFRQVLATDAGDPYVAQWWPPGHILGWEHTFVHQCQDLLAAIYEGRQPTPSFSDGLAVQEVLDAIGRSSRERRFVSVGQAH